jgi:hypothetical protein
MVALIAKRIYAGLCGLWTRAWLGAGLVKWDGG